MYQIIKFSLCTVKVHTPTYTHKENQLYSIFPDENYSSISINVLLQNFKGISIRLMWYTG